jgi:hypothetical protein
MEDLILLAIKVYIDTVQQYAAKELEESLRRIEEKEKEKRKQKTI